MYNKILNHSLLWKLSFLILSFLILNSSLLISQDTWIKTYSPFYIDDGWYDVEDVIVCQDGGYAVNGTFVDYDAEMGIEWAHWGFLMKTDSNGNFLWAKADTISFMYENNSLAFVETSDGGFISAVSGGNLIKRDANGNREWVINGDFGINSMCNTNDGNIILGGCQNLNIGLRKIDENGNTLWTQVYQIDDDNTICKSITELQNGGYALTGYIGYAGSTDSDVLIMITDTTGDSLWTRTFDGYGYRDKGNCIIENNYTDVLVAGIIDTFCYSFGFLWSLDLFGNTLWTEFVDSSIGYEQFSVISPQENEFTALCNSPDGTKVYNFDNYYNIAWESVLPGWAAQGDRGFKKLQDSGYVIGGTYPWCSNIMLVKTDDNGQVYAVEDYELLKIVNLNCYPNPFSTRGEATSGGNPEINISFNLLKTQNVNLTVYNLKGQKIKSLIDNEYINAGIHLFRWDGLDFYGKKVSTGTYLLKLQTKNNSIIKKILLMK